MATLAETLWAAEKAAASPGQQAVAYGATYREDGCSFAYDTLAAAALAWTAEVLAADSTREAVARAMYPDRDQYGFDMQAAADVHADATLAAVREALGIEATT